MKRMTSIPVLLVLILSLAACGSGDKSSADQPADTAKTDTSANDNTSDNNDTKPSEGDKEATGANAKDNEKDSPAATANPMDLSQYYTSDKPIEKESDKSHILWKQGSVTLKASLGKPNEQEKPETSQVVSSLTVDQKDHHIEVKLDPRPYNVPMAALSADESYLALSAEYHETSTLVIIDLKNGTYSTLNQQLEKNGKNRLEILPTFSWSPQGNVLAFSYGLISELSWGLYDADQMKLTFMPPAEGVQSLISTSYVMWSKDGQTVSYISENPSDQMKLYRYGIADASTVKVRDLTREEFDKFLKFSSYILNAS
ncbi:hypothetical protein P4H66_00755 [Paenibacillus dokdonensis]|uniref:Protein TolB n=1 Tax=Paenibacillus dokdonensis TaxID=2567944 RepID=A0ABU6GF90_9BACL|nr:hypothetical protein [Paenibacillus dokdonensis]MEC0238401.1 hypothetical protein [Paenibacillus dokdonensis]